MGKVYIGVTVVGGPNGMVIISAKWATDSSDNINGDKIYDYL